MVFRRIFAAAAAVFVLFVGMNTVAGMDRSSPNAQAEFKRAETAFKQGNFKDAYEAVRKAALRTNEPSPLVCKELSIGSDSLVSLNRAAEIDAFREAIVEAHSGDWRVLWAAAKNCMSVPHNGMIIAGKFYRGDRPFGRGSQGGEFVSSFDRDRIRALQLMVEAMPRARQDENRNEVSRFFESFAEMILGGRGYHDAWRLQVLSELVVLPDYEPGWGGYHGESRGAAVDEAGNPVFYYVPKSFDSAKNDGERWRWCLAESVAFNPGRKNQVRLEFADFLHTQFGVQTMAQAGWNIGRLGDADGNKDESGLFALHSLGEDETIARLATGIKRFTLPEEFNFIGIYKELAAGRGTLSSQGVAALEKLTQLFENRRQYPRAADYCRRLVETLREFRRTNELKNWQERLDQIVGNWGRFEPIVTQPAGRGASLEFRFRNGNQVSFTAEKIKVKQLLDDVKRYIKSHPRQLRWEKTEIDNLGYRLVTQKETKYVGGEVAAWKVELEPRAEHFDRRITVPTPLTAPGAYLLTAKMQGGNTSKIIVWISDTAIVEKPLSEKNLYYVADAVTGKPVAGANLEFFGFDVKHRRNNRTDIDVEQFAESTDADGQVIVEERDQRRGFRWLVTARTDGGRFAFLGFSNVWYGRYHDPEYNAVRVFTITDRPVYRPKQKVHYKFWIRRAQYDMRDVSYFADQTFNVEIFNPKNERIVNKQFTTDAYGGIEGELELPEDAVLGVYRLQVNLLKKDRSQRFHGPLGGSFRVEEYKKPEFEVTVEAPSEPVALGEKITATVRAKYYFGSPVTDAMVKYKVMRTSKSADWFPIGPWDWLYGPGYWWFAYDAPWLPGWRDWGCPRPMPVWWHRSSAPPELVAQREVKIGPDGTLKVEIDTAVAKAVHPDQDHSYTITAEVTDLSRRTIVGSGNVLVARRPFSVYAWVDRGYYRTGDVVRANFTARTLDGSPVQGKGKLALLRVTYADNKPVETPVETWPLDTDARGKARLQLKAARPGQYRLAYKVTDSKSHTIEGGYVFTVIGPGLQSGDFRFNDIELVPDRKEYKPGQDVKLQINTNRTGATVLLFLRPSNGVYLPPRMLHIDGKSTIQTIEVSKKDMPNFFVEAVTVADGQVYRTAKEICVPPEKRVLSIDVKPSAETYRPGQKATVDVKLTDFNGRPFVGSTVIAIYDKSVEYIAGGSNVPNIKEFFWKWRRRHYPRGNNNLRRSGHNMTLPNKPGMNNLGVFGGGVADEEMLEGGVGKADFSVGFARGGGMGMAKGMAPRSAAMPMAEGAVMTDQCLGTPCIEYKTEAENSAPGGGGNVGLVQPTVRKKFADTALWAGALTTDDKGTARVELDMPENLTTWRIKVWGMGGGTRVGQGQTDVVTRKDLILRMEIPRFLVQTDEAVFSAVVHNYLKTKKHVKVNLELDGGVVAPGEALLLKEVAIEPNGETRVDWPVKCREEGEAVVRMSALTDEESDVMEMRIPCYVHGMLKMVAHSGVIPGDRDESRFTIHVPNDRRPEQSRLEVRYSPTLAGAMVDALPYLVEYPYGCTEQTLNRFLPTVITQKILTDMGIDLEAIEKKRTNLNAQEIGDDQLRAEGWKRYKRNPVFSQAELRRMVKDGLKRLTEMQCGDGGWGWFSGWGERSYPHTTATVVHGLQIAKSNDVALVPGVLERGVTWLTDYQNKQVQKLKNAQEKPHAKKPYKTQADNIDALVYMVLVDAGVTNQPMREFLYRDRLELSVYAMAMFGLALEKEAQHDKLSMIMRNISQYVQEDDENQTAWLKLRGGCWWRWYGSENEAQAYYIKLLARTEPKNPVAPRLVKYLLNNRKHATYWNSTRDTAIAIEALAEYLRASGEDRPDMSVEVWFDGELKKTVKITPDTLFTFDNKFVMEGKELSAGEHVVELKRKGRGPLYFNAYETNFTLENHIARAGLEIKVRRKYYRLVPVDKTVAVSGSRGQVVEQRVEKYRREKLDNLDTVTSGDLVEIELEIDSKNDYEYLVFTDMKPAGFEPVDVRSGYTDNTLGAYVEFRDNRVVFFTRTLSRGKHSVAYRMRAETPGRYSALPARGDAMYAPELKGNSDEIKLKIKD